MQVQFPIASTSGSSLPIPQTNAGLWARSFSTSAIAYANVLDSSGCTSGNTAFSSSVGNLPSLPVGSMPNGNHTPNLSSTAATITQKVIPFPPLPTYPSSFTALVTAHKVNELANCSQTQYPKTGDYDSNGNVYSSTSPPTTAAIYKYHITGACSVPSGVTFGANGKEVVVMYLDSTVSIGSNAQLGNSGSDTTKVIWLLKTASLSYGGNSQVGSASPGGATAANWAFFLYSPTATLGMQGTSDIYAFIFAPYASASMGGNPKIAGGLWVKSFSTNGNPPKIFQATSQSDLNTIFTNAYAASGDVITSGNILGAATAFCKTDATLASPPSCTN